MKNNALSILGCIMCLCLVFSCEENTGEEKLPEPDPGTKYSISGSVQKGPFSQGTSITIQALDDNLNPTGRNYSTTTYDDFGAFSIGSEIESRYVEIIADGYYYNEVAGSLSKSPITLRSISDLSEEGQTNINLLTTLESGRIRYLVSNDGKAMSEARQQAEQELYDIFNIPLEVGDSGFDKADISKAGDGNAVLLAISATLQSTRTEAELSELIAKISSEMQNTGALGKSDLSEQIRQGGIGLDYEQIRSNLIARYEQLGQHGYEIPNFEDFMDINGNGVIDREDQWLLVSDAQYQVPQCGGDYSVSVEYNVAYEISIEDGCDWLVISSGGDTKAYLESADYVISVSENSGFSSRRAGITFKSNESSQSVTIYVEQEPSTISVSETEYWINNSEQDIEVFVESTSEEYEVTVTEGGEWLSFIESAEGRLLFHAAASDDFQNDRTGRIEFTDMGGVLLAEVTVIQGVADFSLSQTEFNLDNSSQDITVEAYTAASDYIVSITEGKEWITLKETSGQTYTFSVPANEDFSNSRFGRIEFLDGSSNLLGEVSVTQAPAELYLSQADFTLDNTEQVFNVNVSTNAERISHKIVEGDEWLRLLDISDEVYAFSVSASNDFHSDRYGRVDFYDVNENVIGEVRVTQGHAEMYVEQEMFSIDKAEQTFALNIISSTDEYTVALSEGSAWLTYAGNVGDDWIFSVDENASYLPRKDMIIISDISGQMLDTLTVLQWCETVTQVNVTPGSLESLITQPGQLEYTETFIADGEMNEYDFLLLRQMPRLKNIDISGLVNTILPRSVFQKMYTLEKLSLPSNLVETPYSMCQGCYNLKEALPLPESVVIIGEEMFSGCSSLEGGLILHEGITTIGTGAFNGCSSLTGDLVIPSTVTFMGGYGYIFPGCEKIDKVYMKPATPPATWEGYDMFPNYRYLGVPAGSKELYEADEHYNKFMVIEEVDFDALGL